MNQNTCTILTEGLRNIAFYSHLIPVAISLFLSIYALIKTKVSKLSLLFFSFTLSFSLWLIGDLVLWVYPDYYQVYFFWSWLDYVNIVFFVLGAYFFGILTRGKVSGWEKVAYLLICLPAFITTITGGSVIEFNQPVCEALENETLTTYKLFAELFSVILLLSSIFISWRFSNREKRIQTGVVAMAILLFFGVFSGTEYLATITDVYETSLYGLFVLPLFLIVIVFSITNLKIFQFRFLSVQILVYILIIMVSSQFLFLQSSTDRDLNVLTLIVTILLGYLLLQNAKKEEKASIQIEKLASELKIANKHLEDLNQQKTEFISFASHQLRGPLTSIKGYASLILEGDFGAMAKEIKEAVQIIYQSTQSLVIIVGDYLDVSRIELGKMKYDFKNFDLRNLVKTVVTEFEPNVKISNLDLNFEDKEGNALVYADEGKVKQVISNLIDNSMKYTKKGGITVGIEPNKNKIRIFVKDTGVGIPQDVIPKLFEKFSRAPDASKTNILGTGLGLFVAKKMVEAHKGKIWAESEGKDKGSTFILELDTVESKNPDTNIDSAKNFAKAL